MIQLILGRPLVVATLVVLLLAFYGLRSGRKELDGLTDASDLLTQVENYKRESEKLREDNEECWRLIKALRAKNGKKYAEEQEKRLSKKETEWWNLREQLEKENRKLKKELKIKTSKKILTKVAAAIQAEEDSSRKPKNNVSKRKAV